MKARITSIIAAVFAASSVQASLWVDFNSGNQDGGPELEPGYQAFTRDHENNSAGTPFLGLEDGSDFDEDFTTNFAGTPSVNLSVA